MQFVSVAVKEEATGGMKMESSKVAGGSDDRFTSNISEFYMVILKCTEERSLSAPGVCDTNL